MAEPAEKAPEIKDGKLISAMVKINIMGSIEKGAMTSVSGIIVHQTGGKSANSALESYKKGEAGAHFLIDTDGKIYQTARTDQKCYHVGKLRSRCYENKSCDVEEMKAVKGILFKKGQVYSSRVSELNKHEQAKSSPDRYPSNEDSIGIEIVGGVTKEGSYELVSNEQNASLKWLVSTLIKHFGIGSGEVFKHPEVSYKQPTEASTATWQ
jgi:N-acetyl-anhydromuramyl-L-alanine amidase AmpD